MKSIFLRAVSLIVSTAMMLLFAPGGATPATGRLPTACETR